MYSIWTKKVYVNDTNSDAAPSYSVTSANVGYAWVMGDWKVNSFARVDNLFDKNMQVQLL